jgi:hypothetical protein
MGYVWVKGIQGRPVEFQTSKIRNIGALIELVKPKLGLNTVLSHLLTLHYSNGDGSKGREIDPGQPVPTNTTSKTPLLIQISTEPTIINPDSQSTYI